MESYAQQWMGNRSKKNMLLMGSGLLISLLGTQVFNFAVGLYVLKMTGSGLNFAITLAVGALPRFILAPFMGVFVDRWDKKRLIYLSDFICGAIVLNMLLWSYNHSMTIELIYFTTFWLAIFNTLFDISATAVKPSLVEEEELMKINSLDQGIMSLAMILGPLLGGMLYTLMDFKVFIILNGCSFIMSGISECFLDIKETATKPAATGKSILHDMKTGVKYLMNHSGLRRVLSLSIVLNFFIHFAVVVPLPYILNVLYEVDAKAYGVVNGAFPMGVLVATYFLFKLKDQRKVYPWIPFAVLTYGSLMFLMSLPVWPGTVLGYKSMVPFYYGGLMFVFGLNIAILDIPFMAYAQKSVDPALRGRVFSTFLSISKIMSPLALVLSGFILEWVEVAWICAGGSLIMTLLLLRLGVMKLGTTIENAFE